MLREPPTVTILCRNACPLCEEAIELARGLEPELRFLLETRLIDDDPVLRARYGMQVPVVLIEGIEAGWGRVTAELLRDAVKRARRRRPISRILSRFGLRRKR